MAASSSSSISCKYDVFLSFRGEDTRENFTSHLFAALRRKKINTFVDEGINKGEMISTDLLNTIIEGSKISIIIFSKDYADSKWCLDELIKILDCKKTHDQVVIPVFYHVHPSDVRKQTASFGDAFVQHEKNFKEMPERVLNWKTALTEASYFCGHESAKSRDEAALVNAIVADVLNKLKAITFSTDFHGLVGINWRIEEVKSLLCMGLSDIRIVGIWGMGGIGKTIIAEALFNQISKEFEGACFMANVREESERGVGLLNLQKRLFSQILDENIEIGGPNIPRHTMDRLRRMKVFIVLDDVNKFRQLEQLAGGIDRFGPGSRIIITTRDKQVLDRYKVDHIYEVTVMNNHEALEHFCNFAFRQNHCPQEFTMLSQKVIEYAKGHPLALKVLGSSLHPKSKLLDWENALRNLRRISASDIYDVLKISYDELEWDVKNIFLDIACFFKGDDEDRVILVSNDHDLIQYGLDVLVEKSLITRSYGKLEMHDLLQEMGQKIVYEESPEDPGKHSRLWHHKDVYDVLKKNKGTKYVKGIFLNLSKIRDIRLDSKVFTQMKNIRSLKFYVPPEFEESYMSSKIHFPQGLEYLPDELRYLHWVGYPLRTLPSNFIPENLVELNLSYSKIKKLWKGKQEAPKLKFIYLRHCDYLRSLADALEAPNLERIFISDCEKLSNIPSSIQNFNNLGRLSLFGCTSLSYFPPIHFRSPIAIEIARCMNLTEFPPISGNVINLRLDSIAIEQISSSISNLTSLEKLRVSDCPWLKGISADICKLRSLSLLDVWSCPNLERFPKILEPMESLLDSIKGDEEADLHGCRGLLLPSLSGLSGLRWLTLERCDIREIPQDIGCLSSLQTLYLIENEFDSLPTSIKQLSLLKSLDLSNCNMLKSLPELPRSLLYLLVNNCKRLESLPELPECLETLDAEKLCSDGRGRVMYIFHDCPKLKENASNILADSQLRIQHMATASLYEQMSGGFQYFLPGSAVDIPEWFSNRCSGSSITIQMPPQCGNTRFIGFALCVVVGLDEDFGGLHFNANRRHYLEIKSDISKTCVDLVYFDVDRIILVFDPCSNDGLPDIDHHTAVKFDFSVYHAIPKRVYYEKSEIVKVKRCGVCPVYAYPNEYPPNTFTVNLVPPTEEECRTLHNKFHDEAGTSGTTTEIGSIDRSDQEQINAPQQESSKSDEEEVAVEPTPKRICRGRSVGL